MTQRTVALARTGRQRTPVPQIGRALGPSAPPAEQVMKVAC
ncbi:MULTISPECIES: hypothetical protein [Micromonospora]|nr:MULTISPECIES: hypothetical protein [Micromonospora]WBB87950.1 hypothetical protein O7542_12585 [Micromonospora sp. WMMC264]